MITLSKLQKIFTNSNITPGNWPKMSETARTAVLEVARYRSLSGKDPIREASDTLGSIAAMFRRSGSKVSGRVKAIRIIAKMVKSGKLDLAPKAGS